MSDGRIFVAAVAQWFFGGLNFCNSLPTWDFVCTCQTKKRDALNLNQNQLQVNIP